MNNKITPLTYTPCLLCRIIVSIKCHDALWAPSITADLNGSCWGWAASHQAWSHISHEKYFHWGAYCLASHWKEATCMLDVSKIKAHASCIKSTSSSPHTVYTHTQSDEQLLLVSSVCETMTYEILGISYYFFQESALKNVKALVFCFVCADVIGWCDQL